MENILQENERMDDLEYKGLKIIQNRDSFCFGIDSVILSDFAKEIKPGSNVMDLGTGNGILGILLCAKTKLKTILGIEIQGEMAELAKRNSQLNGLENRFFVQREDIKNITKMLPTQQFDAVVSNPPYKKKETGIRNEKAAKYIARHETTAELEDFIKASSYLLKEKGILYLIHRPERLVDIFSSLRENGLEPKKIRMVQSYFNTAPSMILIKAVKNGKSFLKVESPLIIYQDKNKYSDEILEIYDKKRGE